MIGRSVLPRRVLSALGILGLLATAWLHPASSTDAAWTDTEQATGSFGARVVNPVTLLSPCTANPGPLGLAPAVTVDWTLPAQYSASVDTVEYGAAPGASPAALTVLTTGVATTVNGGGYRTVFSGPALSALLGGYATVGIRVRHQPAPTGWTSQWATATGAAGLLGLGNICNVNPTGTTPA